MSRAIIRAIWGIHDRSARTIARRYNVDDDIRLALTNPYELPFIVYGFGEDNCKQLKDLGLDVHMIDKNPAPFDLVNQQYRNKLDILQYVIEADGYDEILFLDWDCQPYKKVPDDLWELLAEKDVVQANLQQYHRRKCTWRRGDMRKLPNFGFVYIADKSLPKKFIEAWESNPQNSAEPALARVMDDMSGGWQGIEYHWEHYEPDLCDLHRSSVYPNERLDIKTNPCFMHTQG